MDRTAFVLYGKKSTREELVYHEVPRRRMNDELFLFFKAGSHAYEDFYGELFRKAISTSRMGHPLNYFSRFIKHLREHIEDYQEVGEVLGKDSQMLILLRKGTQGYILHGRDSEIIHRHSESSRTGSFFTLPSVKEISLSDSTDQAELFSRSIEEHMALHRFELTEGKHTIAFLPSKEFLMRHRESLENSIFFPSFEPPVEGSVTLDIDGAIPVIHWSNIPSTVEREQPEGAGGFISRIPLPLGIGLATTVIALILLFGPWSRRNEGGRVDNTGSEILMSAEDQSGEESGDEVIMEEDEGESMQKSTPGDNLKFREITVSLKESWKKGFPMPVTSSPCICGGAVFFGCRDGNMYSYTLDGDMRWESQTGAGIGASPACSDDRVVGANYDGDIFCLDVETGKRLWVHSSGEEIRSSVRIHHDHVIAATMEGAVIDLDMKSGEVRWRKVSGNEIWATSAVGDKYIVVASRGGKLSRLDYKGRLEWEVDVDAEIRSSPLCIPENDMVIFGSEDGYINAYSLSEGRRNWAFSTGSPVNGSPEHQGELIYIGSEDGYIYAMGLDGNMIWRRNLGGAILSKPAVIDGKVYTTTYSSKLAALDTRNGEVVSVFKTSSRLYSSPGVKGGTLFFGSMGGMFYAVNLYGEKL